MKKNNLKVVYVDINDLKPSEYNPRTWSDESIKNLTKSIKRFGLVDPIICNSAPSRKNVVIGGHFRLEVAKRLGIISIPIVYLNIPEIEKEKELNLRLNRNTGEWDFDLLKEFDMSLLLEAGFDNGDLSSIWDQNIETEDDDFFIEEELSKISKTNVKVGDIFELGKHRLICGDSTNPEVVKKLLNGEKLSIIYSDPPYNIGLSYDKGLSKKSKYGGKTNDNKSNGEYRKFIKSVIENAICFSDPNLHIFFYCDQKYIGMFQSIYEELGIANQRVCLWVKNGFNSTPQIAFNKCYEPCVYGIKGSPYLSPINNLNEIMNKEIGTGNRTIDDILDIIDGLSFFFYYS